MQNAFKLDVLGRYAFQDPDEDLDWWFDYNDPINPWLATGEIIASVPEMSLKRLDGNALTTETTHDTTFTATRAGMFIRALLLGVTYIIEGTITSNATPPRTVTRSFRVICVEL